MYKSLATKYRPTTFDTVVGQTITTKILKRVVELGSPKNAYLFSGESGCGKTTLARIFANSLNNGIGEPIEIDAASNNGVDQVRAIISSANERSLTGTYKVFIIDEAHAITTAGWQAFLKGIEEPPLFTIFIFCTTEPNKIPTTILNRVQRYNITKISTEAIKERLEFVCTQENFINYSETCDLISKLSNGRMRDALTMLDQCADFSHDLNILNTKDILGEVNAEVMLRLTNYILESNEKAVLSTIDELSMNGTDLKQFINSYLDFILDLTKYVLFKDISVTAIPGYLENATDPYINVKYTTNLGNSPKDAVNWLNGFTDHLLKLKLNIKNDISYKSTIQAYLIKACRG